MTLVVVGTPIGNLGDLSPRATETLAGADVIACEDTRRTRALLSAAGLKAGNRLLSLHEHNEGERVTTILDRLAQGATVAIVSDAGMPSVSDPGQRIVAAAVEAGHPVEVVPGPSAVIAALVVSGMDTSGFCFEGFLPRSGRARTDRLTDLAQQTRTAVIFEAPRRLAATLTAMVERFGPERRVAIVRELTKVHEEVIRGSLGEVAERVAAGELKGEIVVVLEGAVVTPHEYTDDDVRHALRTWLDSGTDRRTAVATVTAELGLPKRRVYAIATTLSAP